MAEGVVARAAESAAVALQAQKFVEARKAWAFVALSEVAVVVVQMVLGVAVWQKGLVLAGLGGFEGPARE